MTPPISIDGTDITGATIDGTDVQEITVDGDVVFTAETLPVAYFNLVAWYPFDSAEYGGSNADDVTAIFNPSQSGDSTAYDGTLIDNPNHLSSGGVTDINAGSNSGAFDFDGSNDAITAPAQLSGTGDFTVSHWLRFTDSSFSITVDTRSPGFFVGVNIDINGPGVAGQIRFFGNDNSSFGSVSPTSNPNLDDGNYHHVVCVYDSNESTNARIHIDGSNALGLDVQNAGLPSGDLWNTFDLGSQSNQAVNFYDGEIDDVRIYNKALSQSEINQIYQNTKP